MSKEKANGGTILNVGSSCSVKPFLSSPIYTATKHAVLGLTKAYGVSERHYDKDYILFIFRRLCKFFAVLLISNLPFQN